MEMGIAQAPPRTPAGILPAGTLRAGCQKHSALPASAGKTLGHNNPALAVPFSAAQSPKRAEFSVSQPAMFTCQ